MSGFLVLVIIIPLLVAGEFRENKARFFYVKNLS